MSYCLVEIIHSMNFEKNVLAILPQNMQKICICGAYVDRSDSTGKIGLAFNFLQLPTWHQWHRMGALGTEHEYVEASVNLLQTSTNIPYRIPTLT